jgi:hypothetical protein
VSSSFENGDGIHAFDDWPQIQTKKPNGYNQRPEPKKPQSKNNSIG